MSQLSVIDVTGDDDVSSEVAGASISSSLGEHADPELSSAPDASALQTLDVEPSLGPTVAPEPEPESIPSNPGTHMKTSIEGLWLFTDVVSEAFQLQLVEFTESALADGRAGQLPGRTFQVSSRSLAHSAILKLPGFH